MRIEIPELMKHRVSLLGEVDQTWFGDVANLVAAIEASWKVKVAEQLSGGTEALVFRCDTAQGSAVLKLGIPGSLGREAKVLKVAQGRGYAKLLEYDTEREAILIEHLGEQLAEVPLSVDQKIEILCSTLKIAWSPIDGANGLMTGAEKAESQANYILTQWEELSRPCSRQIVERALEYASDRKAAYDPANSYLVHGDAHIWNTLRADDSPTNYKFVDPDGLFAEPAVDLAISLREWRDELLKGDTLDLGQRRCDLLSDLTGVHSDAIWQWGFVEHVSCGLLDLHLQDALEADHHFTIAERWLSS